MLSLGFVLTSCGKNSDVKQEVNKDETSTVESSSEEDSDFTIDWNHYEDFMTSDEIDDFKDYLPVLNNEESFTCFNWGDDEYFFDGYLKSIETDDEPDIEGIALVDLDNQNGNELIIDIYEGAGNYLILTRDDGDFYGTSLGCRLFEDLQKDGRYIASGGAGSNYIYTMKIDSTGVEEALVGQFDGDTFNNSVHWISAALDFNELGVSKYQYGDEFEIGDDLKNAIEVMASVAPFYNVDADSEDWKNSFIKEFIQSMFDGYSYKKDIINNQDGIMTKSQVEYIQYSLTGEYTEFWNIDEGINCLENQFSPMVAFNIYDYSYEENGDEINIKAYCNYYKKGSDLETEYLVTATIVRNQFSCFDGYSIVCIDTEEIT